MDSNRWIVVLLVCFSSCIKGSSIPPGHNLPLGSHLTPITVTRLSYSPTPTEFYHNFVEKRLPVVMEGIMTKSDVFRSWQSDHYLRQEFGDVAFNIEVTKKENRSEYGFVMSMEDFLDAYKNEDIYLVDELPPPMIDEWQLPKPLLCGGFTDHLMYAFMWFSSGGTKSVLHTDSGENLHCVVSGRKEWVLIEPKYADEVGPEHKQKGFYDIDVDKVDMAVYRNLSRIPWYNATLNEGDCLFLPYPWIHHVRSFDNNGRSMGINVWWEPFEFNQCDENEETIPDFAPLLHYEFHPEIQVRDDLIQVMREDGNIYSKDFHTLLEERLELEGIHMETQYVEKMFEILQPGCGGIIQDPHSISVDKLRAAFDYILFTGDELYKEQMINEEDNSNLHVPRMDKEEL